MRADAAISFFNGKLASENARLRDAPTSRSAAFFAKAYETYSQDAQDREVLERGAAIGEVVEMRLIGQKAHRGSLPVDTFVDFINPMRRSITRAGHVARYGLEARRTAKDVKEDLDLRVAGMGSGSTRIFLSGSPVFDTTGTNLLSTVASNLFDLLNAQPNAFDSAADSVGPSSLKALGESLRSLESDGLSAEFTWTKDSEQVKWDGSVNEIKRVIGLIESHSPPESIEQTLSGVVSAINDRGMIELTTNGERVKIRYALRDHNLAKQLTFAEPASILVKTHITINNVTDERTETHLLLRIA